jgi:hypothetical protein
VRESNNSQRYSPQVNDQPALTAITVRIAVDVSDNCTFSMCLLGKCQLQQYIKIAAFSVSHVGISSSVALCCFTVLNYSCTCYRND